MKTLDKITNQNFPLPWVDLDSYMESKGDKIEIYLIEKRNLVEGLILMFYTLFRTGKSNIKVYMPSWWDYCLDTWDIKNDRYDYELEGKSIETKDYLLMLKESSIELGYSGICSCNDWDKFLSITLTCIVTHKAPYSPIFYDEENDFFFYFHHTGSMGFYYKTRNEVVEKILNISKREYDVR
ncbi:hypothetical protein [Sphingobacterium haloxyli]|uniref:Uncharacterized protein n=1 Tax=Sphingobacterium haloxyli TaxID=2100533 RepID=A0A2S9IVH9_9SPHI|nr:hypothetical protein [Sphingobacterium haloxyli]PRD44536.1 hypothetical protein C5745_19350 [Sphingobacterium haloxyli]